MIWSAVKAAVFVFSLGYLLCLATAYDCQLKEQSARLTLLENRTLSLESDIAEIMNRRLSKR